jgi:glycosyltransferase involved in cell wall biosynthesis
MAPRISLAMPVCNGENFISTAMQSLLDQTFSDFELIITDNASTDATESICREFAQRDARIKYIRNKGNLGAAANFNLGFRHSSGEYFKWCAHDDFISANFLNECVHALESNKADVLAYGRQQGVDHRGNLVSRSTCEVPDLDDRTPGQRFALVYRLQGFDAAMFGLIRRTALQQSSLHASYYGSDIALLAELALLGSFRQIAGATFYNRDHRARSINITTKRARQTWHAPEFSSLPLPEHLSLLRHLAVIALKHRKKAPLQRTLLGLAAWAMTPQQVARYALDTLGFVSPAFQAHLRTAGRRLLFRFLPKQRNVGREECP